MIVRKATWALHAVLAASMALTAGWARSHGDFLPKHGGLMSRGGEVSFELVVGDGQLIVYMEDHGTPIPSDGVRGSVRSALAPAHHATLVPDGSNRFIVKGLTARPGERLVFAVGLPDGTGGGAFVDIPCPPRQVCGTTR